MSHSHEEIRNAILDVLTGKVRTSYTPDQFNHLKIGVAAALAARGLQVAQHPSNYPADTALDHADAEICREVFWDLFRQGVVTLGVNDANPEYPWFKVTAFGEKLLQGENQYFSYDTGALEKRVRQEIPNIDEVTLIYLKEAFQAFRSGCMLSAAVMMGVAAENTFELLLETIQTHPTHKLTFAAVSKERTILPKLNKFYSILVQNLSTLPAEVKEDLETRFIGIISLVRNYRNQSGHPTGKIVDREQTYILMQLFIPYCKKVYQLRAHYSP